MEVPRPPSRIGRRRALVMACAKGTLRIAALAAARHSLSISPSSQRQDTSHQPDDWELVIPPEDEWVEVE
jgi:hypothetical protein